MEPWAVGLEDLAGYSVLFKNEDGEVFHTYSTFARGIEEFAGIYRFLDIARRVGPKMAPYHTLGDWARPKNMYGKGGMVEPNGRYHAPACGCAAHK